MKGAFVKARGVGAVNPDQSASNAGLDTIKTDFTQAHSDQLSSSTVF